MKRIGNAIKVLLMITLITAALILSAGCAEVRDFIYEELDIICFGGFDPASGRREGPGRITPNSDSSGCGSSATGRPNVDFERIMMALDGEVYKTGETITVTVRNLPRFMYSAGAFIAIYYEGAVHSAGQEHLHPGAGNSIHEFTAPVNEGNYEIRLYRQDNAFSDEAYEMNIPFVVVKVAP